MSEDFEKMTVVDLRRVAKEMGVKLGAGISKQGIIEKLTAASSPQDASSASGDSADSASEQDFAAHPIRSAAIITDDEPEDDEDDIPVLTPNPALQAAPRPAPRPAAAAPASPSPAPGASSLSNISSKAPAFTMEGSRAWHNPRAFQGQNPTYPRAQSQTQPWSARPAQPAMGAEQRTYRMSSSQRPDARTAQPRSTSYAPRFGPDQLESEPQAPDYRSGAYAPAPQQDYAARNDYAPRSDYSARQDYAPRSDYAPRQDYAAPRESNPLSPSSYGRSQQSAYYHKDLGVTNPAVPEMLATGECGDGEGVLELHPDGFGFLRADNFLPGKNDVYISNAQIRRFSLRSGDYIVGKTRPQRETDRYCAMLYITDINGHPAEEVQSRVAFEDLTPIYPKRRISLSGKGCDDPVLRIIDLLSPIGFGQRAMIVAPPKTGKTTLLKKLAGAIAKNHPKAHLMVLLVDERPEEVTDMKESVKAEVIYSPFDEPPESHARASELTLERALRLVEQKKDVIILTDSLTRMARAYNVIAPQNVRVLAGGLAAGAMNKPKRFFGAARNTKEGGTLTIIATALVDTGSKIDEAIFEEFKGTGNMELVLDRLPSEKRVFPAVNLLRCGTRHDELLLSEKERDVAAKIRALLADASPAEAMGQLLSMLEKTETNEELADKFDQWMSM